eukprot:CAMPEP_0202917676 /NCGR_PEP_ID=MMETSP1392-20130828/71574_1 /ASSEMBLY_ACC=CAM_ASM_000868 /TAXON_ID=225041 /ORGANISM="Chlamydomonas chlamydogama, Strain SAG 11-48b" /LENGTH=131 /DNA_ID=CAMNT_0049610497 /DNA_START=1 /DNA_END=393 /DNA_ORIENTATION=+
MPLSLFTAERVDLSLLRLAHYCGTSPSHFQGFVLLTNYQRYIDEFIKWGTQQVQDPNSGYISVIGPQDTVIKHMDGSGTGEHPDLVSLPQMPAYHLVRQDRLGITMININVGPSNAKTITDHLAVLRPHCW